MKKYKVVGLPKMQNGGPGDKKDPDNFTNEELTDYGNMQINVGDSDQGYYGDKHRQRTNKIYTSLNQLKKLFTEGQLNAVNGEWDYDNQIDAQGIYDDESENLIKRYQGLEDLMKLNFGDRKGDPTRAVDWMNKDGRRYRKSLRALESDIQDLYLRRMEQYGKNTGVTSYGDNVQYDYVKSTDPEDKIYDEVTGEWTGEYRDKAIPRKAISYDNEDEINLTNKGITSQIKRTSLNRSNVNDREYVAQQIAEKGYVPKQYAIEFQDAVVYAKDRDKERQEKLTAEAERLFIEGAKQGYLPSSVVPIGGKIEDLRSFIKDQKKNLRKYSKNRDLATIQKQKDAEFLNVSADLLGTVEGEKLVRERLKTASDEDQRFLVNLYQKYFSDYDPNAVQFTQEEVNEMQEGFKGKARGSKELDYMSLDNPTGVIQDIAAATAYTAPAIATGQAFLNPTIQNILTPYFAYEAVKDDGVLDQAVDEFSKGEYWDGTVDAGFGLLDVFAFKGLVKTLKTPGAVTRFFSKLKSKNLPKGYLEKINNSLPPMLQLDNIDDVPRNLKALPLVGTAGVAAAAAASDEDPDASMMAALPLMIFGRGKKINLKNVYKNIANWFKTVPALKNVPFKQSELQSSVLKNLPAKFKKEFGPDVTFEQLVKEQPEMLKNLIVEHIVDRYEYYESNIPGIPTVRRVTERELPIFYAEQDEAAQFALDFNTAWMEGSLDPRSKELIKPVKDGIKEARELEEEIVSLKPLYDDAIKEVRDGIQNDWNRKVIFPGSMGPMSDAASKEEAVKIGKDLLKVYKDAAAKVVGTENHGNYNVLIKDLEDDIVYIAQMGVDNFRKLNKHNTAYSFTEFQAEKFINANSDTVYNYWDVVDRKNAAYDKVKDQIDAIGPVENVLAPDIAERVNALRGNVQDILDTSKAVTLDARGGVNKESVDGDIISGLVEGRYSESDLKGTVGESMKGDYQGFYGVKSTTNKGNVGQITKRGLPANSDNLDELYTMYEKGLFGDKLKGLVVRQEDTLRQPIDVAGTMAHEDKHIYQSLIGYLDPHVESQIYGYNVADQKSDLGKAIQEVLIEPKKIDDPTANVDAGDTYTNETYQASPIEVDANLQGERVKYAYKKFQEIMNADNPVSKFRKLKESAGSDARYQKAVIEEIVRVMKIPENKAQFIEDLMSSPIGNAVNQHFKQKYKGVIDPLTDDTKTMAGKEMARQFLEMLPALLIGAGLAAEVSNDESPEELMTAGAGILGFATRGKIKGLSKFRGVTKTPLTFKSFMPNGKIMNLAKDKMGRIPTEQALAILAKEGSGSYKSEVLAEALKTKFNGKVPSKIDPEILKNLAEETIIPLNLEVVDKKTTVGVNPEFGFDHIGYRDPKQQEIIGRSLTSNAEEAASEEARIATQQFINARAEQIKELEKEMDNLEDVLENFDDYEDKGYFPTGTRPSEFKKELEEITKKYEALMADKPPHNLENNTILFDSDALPGLGSDDHSSGVNNLAHVHYTVRSDSPDTFTVTQFQSDFFQDREKRLPRYLDATDETLDKHINYQEKQYQATKSLQDNAVDLGNGKSRLADGTVVWNEYFQNSPPDRSMIEKYTTIKKNREPIKILQKTWEARTLQETVDYAARNGQTKFRFPTGETASKLQNYGDDVTEAVKTGSKEKLVKTGDEEKLQITKRYEKTYPKLIEKIYGVKLRKVSDAQGNSWWEFDIPKDMIEGTRDIIAYKEGGQIKRKLKRPNPQFEELELTEEEALAYAQKGYVVEAIS